MESWRTTWRKGVVPLLSTRALEALRDALASDDVHLLQGATTVPPPLQCVQEWPCEAACGLGLMGACELGGFAGQSQEPATVAEVEEYFARMCFDIDQLMGESAACRWFLNWFDDTPRDEMRRELLPEVQRALAERSQYALAQPYIGTPPPTPEYVQWVGRVERPANDCIPDVVIGGQA